MITPDGDQGDMIVRLPDGRKIEFNIDHGALDDDQQGALNCVLRRQYEELHEQRLAARPRRNCVAWITCPCGRRLGLAASYKCLYCGAWFCKDCAIRHFGSAGERAHRA